MENQYTAHEHKKNIHFCQRALGKLIWCHSMKDATAVSELFVKTVTSQTHNEVVENFIIYLERWNNEFKEVEELLERFEYTKQNEGYLTKLPLQKG